MSSLLSYFSPPCVHVALHHPYSRGFKGPSEASERCCCLLRCLCRLACRCQRFQVFQCCCSPQQLLQVAAFHSHSKEDQIQGHLSSASKLGRPSTKAFSGLPRPQLAAAARAAGAGQGAGRAGRARELRSQLLSLSFVDLWPHHQLSKFQDSLLEPYFPPFKKTYSLEEDCF